jgi:hypothetical protein
MSPRRGDRHRDLLLTAVLALIGALAAIFSLPSWLQFTLLAPLALVLPGYAITAALFPPGALPPSERLVNTFVFSLSAAAIGGIVFQLVLGLDRTAWIFLELGITLVAVSVALRRRAVLPIQLQPRRRERRNRRSLKPAGALLFCVAAGILVVAIASASTGTRGQQSEQVFTSLWAVPGTGPQGPVRVGVWNHGGPASFSLEARAGDELLARVPVRLGSRQKWERLLPPPVTASSGDLVITIFHRSQAYRSVKLNIGEAE